MQARERSKSLLVAPFEREPAGRLGEGVDQGGKGDHRQKLKGKREAPLARALILQDESKQISQSMSQQV